MAVNNNSNLVEAFTFDDVLLKPVLSDVLPSEVDVRTRITRSISLNLPVVAEGKPFPGLVETCRWSPRPWIR